VAWTSALAVLSVSALAGPVLRDPSPLWQEVSASMVTIGFDSQRAAVIAAWLAAGVVAGVAALLTQRTGLGTLAGAWLFAAAYGLRQVPRLTSNPPILFGFPEQLSRATLARNVVVIVSVAVVVSFMAAASGRALSCLVTGSIGAVVRGVLARRSVLWPRLLAHAAGLVVLTSAVVVTAGMADPIVRYGPDHGIFLPSLPNGAVTTGRIEDRSFFSTAMGEARPYSVYLPPGYSPHGSRRYPVLYLLHGDPGSHHDWPNIGLKGVLDSGIARGAMPPVIAVVPDGNGQLTPAPQWADHLGGGDRIESSVLELVRLVDRTYPTLADRRHRLIAGLSSGGFGAANLAARHPDLFSTAICLSGYFTAQGPVFGGDPSYLSANSPELIVRDHVAARRVDYILVVGRDDGDYLKAADQFNAELSRLGVQHELVLLPGGHQRSVWTTGLMLGLVHVKPQTWPTR
jgi:enterochelin esterase-like enzyme